VKFQCFEVCCLVFKAANWACFLRNITAKEGKTERHDREQSKGRYAAQNINKLCRLLLVFSEK
jgi:hypothetical protein